MPESRPSPASKRRKPASAGARPAGAKGGIAATAPDHFYRDLVWSLRNGVIAVTADGHVAVMNDVAYRILGLAPRTTDIGRHYLDVLAHEPDIARMVASAFEASHLPNRAELRLKTTGKVIGYTLSQVRNAWGRLTGATLFFKDLTRVEQLEERERLRDRLAALGEMAAAIAHEVKNPLAGIEVMAGLLKRQLSDTPDAQSVLADIIKEAKMANAIVLEVLEFVRPIRLQVERVSLAEAIRGSVALVEAHAPLERRADPRDGSRGPACDPGRRASPPPDLHEPADQRVRGARRRRHRTHRGAHGVRGGSNGAGRASREPDAPGRRL